MLNIHLNGDVVQLPDVAAAYRSRQAKLFASGHCRYGVIERECPVFYEYKKHYINAGCPEFVKFAAWPRCTLCRSVSGKFVCPKAKQYQEHGKKSKKFEINNKVYRKLASSANYMFMTARHKVLFFTLTLPPVVKQPTMKELNECFSKFVENLKKTYGCKNYIAVREGGFKNAVRPHYHVLCVIPFIDLCALNNYWCNVLKPFCKHSKNALQTDSRKRIIKDPVRAIKYVCKYFSKARYQKSDTRLYFISNILMKQIQLSDCSAWNLLQGYKMIEIRKEKFVTMFRIRDEKYLRLFFRAVLYPLVKKEIEKINLKSRGKNRDPIVFSDNFIGLS